jgi:hypothetical protein
MNIGQKEVRLTFAGLAMVIIGVAWFALSVAGVFDGAVMMSGYFLGMGLAICGLIVSGVYFFRYLRIKKLLQGKNVLAQWENGEGRAVIASTCAFVDGELYLWGLPGTRLEDVQIERRDLLGSERSYLQITFGEAASQARDMTGARLWQTRKLSIRIPDRQGPLAQTVLEQLKTRL